MPITAGSDVIFQYKYFVYIPLHSIHLFKYLNKISAIYIFLASEGLVHSAFPCMVRFFVLVNISSINILEGVCLFCDSCTKIEQWNRTRAKECQLWKKTSVHLLVTPLEIKSNTGSNIVILNRRWEFTRTFKSLYKEMFCLVCSCLGFFFLAFRTLQLPMLKCINHLLHQLYGPLSSFCKVQDS